MKTKSNRISIILVLILSLISSIKSAYPCTAFYNNNKGVIVLGYNYDWDSGSGIIVANPRNVAKSALIMPGNLPAKWMSRFGSVTFNPLGQDFPMAGMNEKGLVIVALYFADTKYPEIDKRATIQELQWIQFQLDVSESIDDIIKSNDSIRIDINSFPVHFMVADKRGNKAVIEFVDGEMLVLKDAKLPYPVLGNSSYSGTLSYLQRFIPFGGDRHPDFQALRNYENWNTLFIASKLSELNQKQSIHKNDLFNILKDVRISEESIYPNRTQWSILFNPITLSITFATRSNNELREVNIGDFSFNCGLPRKHQSLSSSFTNSSEFLELDFDKNREAIQTTYSESNHLQRALPREILFGFINYFRSTECSILQ